MFRSWLKIVDRCEHCGLDYRFAAPDDGPALFSLCIIALPLIFFVVWLQVAFEPPFWVHALLWIPAALIVCLGLLRPLKGLMIALQFANNAAEGRLER